ncbi:hypothetical protein MSC49_11260 [Methylosinus sp. C49]|nr:hypothetical protein MSC49_11260 [Methylosinus sp. C49]
MAADWAAPITKGAIKQPAPGSVGNDDFGLRAVRADRNETVS